MKPFVKIFLLIAMLAVITSAVFATPVTPAKKVKDTVTVASTPYRDLLVLKAGKVFIGATVQVYDEHGTVVATSAIHKKKMIIDFYDIPYGTYTIQVTKNKRTILEFSHIKKQDSEVFH